MVPGVSGPAGILRADLLGLVAEAVSVGLLVTTADGLVVWANHAMRRLVGPAGHEAGDDAWPRIGVAVDFAAAGLSLQEGAPGAGRWQASWRAPDGALRWLDVECRPLLGVRTEPGTVPTAVPAMTGMAAGRLLLYEITDVTARRQEEEGARGRERRPSLTESLGVVDTGERVLLAEHDPLTGLRNRHSVTAYLQERRGTVTGRTGALLLLGIDHFRDVNDLRGHAVGDRVIRTLAHVLRERADPHAVLGRLGGDEFAIILPEGDAVDAMATAESFRHAVAARPIVVDDGHLRITVSIGVALVTPSAGGDTLLGHAGLALHEAKRAGGNRARLFTPEQYHHTARRVSMLHRVRSALDAGLMAMHAQPIVDLSTRKVMSHELLIRLRDGIDPPLGPAEFLPPVERTDLVLRLDRWVVEQAATALGTEYARQSGLRLEVNVSSRSMEDLSFGDHVVRTLHSARVEPARLGLEITETAAITRFDAARRIADRLTGAGCRFILDDFGSGFGSFSYLKHLPFTAVKIAGEFVRQVDQGATDTVLVDAVVRVARGLGMRTIAEYVDREPLVDTLHRLGVDRAQGFHIGRPRPLSELLGAGPVQGPS